VNKEAGLLTVRATGQQHQEINQFLKEVSNSAQRQVLIEATIAEVTLNEEFQAGIDWSLVQQNSNGTASFDQVLTGAQISPDNSFSLDLTNFNFFGDSLNLTLRALETFGDVSIMSSPKVMALNNQTALLKVVDNFVYFTLSVDVDPGDADSDSVVTYESELHTIPVGFVMLKVNSGEIAVIGGLMQDEISESTNAIPLLGQVPLLGPLFRYQENKKTKTELVIFLKPVVIDHASVDGDLREFKRFLPSDEQ